MAPERVEAVGQIVIAGGLTDDPGDQRAEIGGPVETDDVLEKGEEVEAGIGVKGNRADGLARHRLDEIDGQPVLGRPATVERVLADARGCGNLLHRGTGEPAPSHHVTRRIEDHAIPGGIPRSSSPSGLGLGHNLSLSNGIVW